MNCKILANALKSCVLSLFLCAFLGVNLNAKEQNHNTNQGTKNPTQSSTKAQNEPKKINIGEIITEVRLLENALLIGTDKGRVLLYDLQNNTLSELLVLPKVENYAEKGVGAHIHSFDLLENTLFVVSEGNFGSSNLTLVRFKDNKIAANTEKLATITKDNPFKNTKKVFLLSKDRALVAMMSSELVLVGLPDFNVLKSFKFSHTSLKDIMLDEPKERALVATESGEVRIFGLGEWKVLENHWIHKDFVYQASLKNGVIASCGNDRQFAVFKNGELKSIPHAALVNVCALSPSAKLAAYAIWNNQSQTKILRTSDMKVQKTISNAHAPSQLIFLNDNELLSVSGDVIYIYGLK